MFGEGNGGNPNLGPRICQFCKVSAVGPPLRKLPSYMKHYSESNGPCKDDCPCKGAKGDSM